VQTFREIAIDVIRQLPDDVSIDDIIDKLKFIKIIKRGIEDLEAGNTVTHKEAEQVLDRWLK